MNEVQNCPSRLCKPYCLTMAEQEPHQNRMQKTIAISASIFILLVIAFIVWLSI